MDLHGYGPALLEGLGLTLRVSAWSLAWACVFGLAGALAKLGPWAPARWCAQAYTTLVRGLPELVLLLAVFYGGQLAVNALALSQGWDAPDIDPVLAGVLTLGFIFGAYLTETFRGAILAIPPGQLEAARACGMSRTLALRRVVLPQMLRHALPGFTNNWLVMLKSSALVSVIGLDDMVHRAGLASASTRQPFTFFMAVALLYLALTSVSMLGLAGLHKRFNQGVRSAVL